MESNKLQSLSLFLSLCGASAVISAALMGDPAFSAPLDKGACENLTRDMQNLKALDVGRLMERGPEWAVSNLSQSDLDLVRRYIDLDEQIKFRCLPPSSLVHLRGPDRDDEEDETSEKPAADGAAKANVKPKPDNAPAAAKKKQAKAQSKSSNPLQAHNGLKPASEGAR